MVQDQLKQTTIASTNTHTSSNAREVALLVTCLVDLFRPSIGFASVQLLEEAGCHVSVPLLQTCCGQPAYNAGDVANTRAIAMQVIEIFEQYDAVVVPSGSCAAMIKKHYIHVFDQSPQWKERADKLAQKTYELTSFLTDVLGQKTVSSQWHGQAVYHDSCSGLRELSIQHQPRRLLRSVKGLKLNEMKDCDVCCGFGGMFCVKYPNISNAMLDKKTENVVNTSANLLLAGDLGCLMNMAGKLNRQGQSIEVRHVAEVLAGMHETPAIGAIATKLEEAHNQNSQPSDDAHKDVGSDA